MLEAKAPKGSKKTSMIKQKSKFPKAIKIKQNKIKIIKKHIKINQIL